MPYRPPLVARRTPKGRATGVNPAGRLHVKALAVAGNKRPRLKGTL